MKLGHFIIYVENVNKTLDFYKKAFGLESQIMSIGEYGELNTGSVILSFMKDDKIKKDFQEKKNCLLDSL